MAIKNEYNWAVTIEVGRHNITKTPAEDTIYAGSYGIANAIVHNLYNQETNANDIAVVRSSTFIRFK